jgi:hypothetical protein
MLCSQVENKFGFSHPLPANKKLHGKIAEVLIVVLESLK